MRNIYSIFDFLTTAKIKGFSKSEKVNVYISYYLLSKRKKLRISVDMENLLLLRQSSVRNQLNVIDNFGCLKRQCEMELCAMDYSPLAYHAFNFSIMRQHEHRESKEILLSVQIDSEFIRSLKATVVSERRMNFQT